MTRGQARSVARSAARSVFGLALAVHLVVLYAPRAPAAPGPVWIDKTVHVAIFAAVGMTAVWAGLPARPVVAVLLGHAVVSELVQATLLPDRSGDVLDALADAAGVLLAWFAVGRAWPGSSAVPGDGPTTHGR